MTINLSELNFTNDFTSVPMPKGNTLVMNKVNESLKITEAKLEDNKEVTITENGTVEITPSEGYDGMKKVTATVNVAGGGGENIEPFHAYIPSYEDVEVCLFGGENTVKILKGTDLSGEEAEVYDCIPYNTGSSLNPLIPCIGATLFVMRASSGGLENYILMKPAEDIEIGQSVEGYFKIVNGEYTEITDSSEVAVAGITYYERRDAYPPFLVEWDNKQYLCESSYNNEAIPEYTE